MNKVWGSLQQDSEGTLSAQLAFALSPLAMHDGGAASLAIPHTGKKAESRSFEAVNIAAAIIHEISQPLAAIAANAQAASIYANAKDPDLEALRNTIQLILRDCRDASQTVQGIRSLFSKGRAEGEPVHLPSAIRDVLRQLDAKMQQSGVNARVSIDDQVHAVAGNRLQLYQLLRNLMTNAVEAMEENSRWPKDVEITVSETGGMVLTEVADRGPGVADCEKIFNAFFSTKKTGMGIGLRICRKIVEAHHGRLWASPRCDRGTVFSFALPLARA